MSHSRPRHAPPLPLEEYDLLSEILLRLPPHPASFLRASLVCRLWRCLLRDLAFLRRDRAFHRTPPVLGFYRLAPPRGFSAFLPIGEAPDRVPAARFELPDAEDWILLGCRHGRVLLRSRPAWLQLLVWDPLTGHRRHVRLGRLGSHVRACHATVLGDRGGLGRREGCSFRVAFVFTGGGRASACLYSSATGAWGRLISTEACYDDVDTRSSALVGDALYCILHGQGILELHLGKETLTMVDGPPCGQALCDANFQLVEAKGGVLGFAVMEEQSLHFWTRAVDRHGSGEWVLRKIIDLEGLVPAPEASLLSMPVRRMQIIGVNEGGSFAFLWTASGIYMVFLDAALDAPLFKKVSDAIMQKPWRLSVPIQAFMLQSS